MFTFLHNFFITSGVSLKVNEYFVILNLYYEMNQPIWFLFICSPINYGTRDEEGGMYMSYVITGECIGEKAGECVEVCPVDCIIEGEDQFFIDPDLCIDCGACQAVCPVEAIWHEEDLLPEDLKFLDKAKEFFAQNG